MNAVGVDIGGTHVTAAVIDVNAERVIDASRTRREVNSHGPAHAILRAWTEAIQSAIDSVGAKEIEAIGFAMPGPFDYERGICAIPAGQNKFENLFGINVRQWILGSVKVPRDPNVRFQNDGECFALGEAWIGAGRGASRVVAITLGTGLGSAFLHDGRLVTTGDHIPESGWLYCLPYDGAIAEETFSARGLLRRYGTRSKNDLKSVAELATCARDGDSVAADILREFGKSLGEFLQPWLLRFGAQRLVVGGSIAKSWDLFGPSLRSELATIDARPAELFEDAALVGAARAAGNASSAAIDESHMVAAGQFRKSRQTLMPATKSKCAPGQYDLYPTHDAGEGAIRRGVDSLANALMREKTLVIDGYSGVFFDDFRHRLDAALRRCGIAPIWYESRVALRSSGEIEQLIAPFLGGDDPLFGTRCTRSLHEFFAADQLAAIKPDPGAQICILIGAGASLAGWRGPIVYLDVPKNEIQFRARSQSVTNLGASAPVASKEMYKRFYFVDWVVLNDRKRALLPLIHYFVDTQRPEDPAWMRGEALRAALDRISRSVFRVRPWFEPGPWGGHWMKENFKALPETEPNYAWSFEMIVPENGLLLSNGEAMLETSFDMLMFRAHDRVLGDSARFFQYEFPIRFDYLDTVRGGNLSVQCHPRQDYIRKHFGETFTQDETYYIHQADPGARVYLGFRDEIDPNDFRAALEASARDGARVDIDRFVASWPAKKHDLFLIPNGTIHCSGVGNLVLEISATPYIFTFKMYDWMRLDLDGKPRSLNIARAFDNLYFDRKGGRIRDEFISKPREVSRGADWRIVHLPTHAEHFYDVRRYEFATTIEIETAGSCHVANLVEGSHISASTADSSMQISHGETFVIPAAANTYKLVNESKGVAMVVVAFVKPDFNPAS